ncbi:MAG: cyclopropane-fatty-acyl-phospholipid synthase [Solirubrobacterales bacterium]|jgi:cyclopropane-fatty-acyl-phospholipid synthase|nr:cyclopropane-fatty-acyl-phospholipid synthase [Solirubrobacterales bacterium]
MGVPSELARRALFRALSRIRRERIEITEGGSHYGFGPAGARLRARLEVLDPRAYSWALRGSTGLGEGYIEGLWRSSDLVALSRIACRNLPRLDAMRRRAHPVLGRIQRAVDLVPRNTRSGARANISAHYDLGNELFEAFLDQRLIYSAAVFPAPDASLEDAQLLKLERICEALDLGPDDHLLEIGTGWGGLAVHAASTRGCRVTTTTISREQRAYAVERVRKEGLDDRIEVLLTDYRDLGGTYDKLASIEMIEAVGWQYFPAFFAKCSELTKPGGTMFLQAIVIEDDNYETEKAARSFSNKHIFPGGCLPSLAVITELGAASGIPVTRCDEISSDYARTLEIWRQRFNDAWPGLLPNGYDERFRRLWNFYLASAEGGFRERRIRDLQIVMSKPGGRPGKAEERAWRSPIHAPARANLSS